MARKRMHKRANGEGSIYLRSDGRWAGEITTGYDERGRQIKPRVYGRTQAEARAKLGELKKRVSQGLPAKIERLTVADFFLKRWLRLKGSQPQVSYKTAESYRYQVRDHILPVLGRFELGKLMPEQVQEFITALASKTKRTARRRETEEVGTPETLSSRTIEDCLKTLRTALNVAVEWNLIARNPAASITVKQARRRRPTIFDEQQAAAFIEGIYGERLEALYWLALCLGPREGELLGLQWADFNFETAEVRILRSLQRMKEPEENRTHLQLVPTKTEESDRSIWLPQIVIEKVLAHRRRQDEERKFAGSGWIETGMVFATRKGTMLDPANMAKDFHRIRGNGKLPRIRFHDLRHSAATILKMSGVPDPAIQNMLGHRSVRTTQEIYTHLTRDGAKQAATKIDEIFGPVAVRVAVKNADTKPS